MVKSACFYGGPSAFWFPEHGEGDREPVDQSQGHSGVTGQGTPPHRKASGRNLEKKKPRKTEARMARADQRWDWKLGSLEDSVLVLLPPLKDWSNCLKLLFFLDLNKSVAIIASLGMIDAQKGEL